MGATVSSKLKALIEPDRTLEKLAYLRNTMLFMIMDEARLRDLAREFCVQKLQAGENLNSKTYVVVADGELSISTLIKKESDKAKKAKKAAQEQHRVSIPSEDEITGKESSLKAGEDGKLSSGSGSLVFGAMKNVKKFAKKAKTTNVDDFGGVTEMLCVKKVGDFFSKASREATSRNAAKVSELLSLTTVRAMVPSTVLTLTHKGLSAFLARNPSENGMLLQAFSSDNITHLQQVPFLQKTPLNGIVSLSQLFSYEAYGPNETVFQEGDMGSSFYLVLQGKLKVLAYNQDVEGKKGVLGKGSIGSTLSRMGTKFLKGVTRSVGSASNNIDEGDEDEIIGDENTSGQPLLASLAVEPAIIETASSRIKSSSRSSAKVAVDNEESKSNVSSDNNSRTSSEISSTSQKVRKTSFVPRDTMLNDRRALHIAELSASDYFGEFALLVNMKRSATVITSEKTMVMKLTKEHFNNFLKVQPEIRGQLELHAKERMMKMLYAFKIPFFRGLKTPKLIEMAAHCELIEKHAGDVLMRQGEPGSTFYIVYDGELTVSAKPQPGGVATRNSTLTVGSYCGEISLVKECDHMATVTVKSPTCVLLTINRTFFAKFFDENRSLLAELELRVMGKDSTLEHVLAHPFARERFKTFLVKEFTSEHLEFVECTELFRKTTRESDLKLMAQTIVDQFFAEGAPHVVNVASAVRDEVNSDFESGKISATMFDRAHHEVMHMMETDNYSRFKQQKIFKKLLNKLKVYRGLDHEAMARPSTQSIDIRAGASGPEKFEERGDNMQSSEADDGEDEEDFGDDEKVSDAALKRASLIVAGQMLKRISLSHDHSQENSNAVPALPPKYLAPLEGGAHPPKN